MSVKIVSTPSDGAQRIGLPLLPARWSLAALMPDSCPRRSSQNDRPQIAPTMTRSTMPTALA